MMTVSLREFQRKASEYLKQLPVQLTVNDKVVATVSTGAGNTEIALTDVYSEDKIDQLVQLATKILAAVENKRDYDRNPLPSKDLEYQPGYFEKQEKLKVAREALEQATSSPEAAKPISKGLSRCNICHQLRENVRPVEYLFEGDRTVDEMCTGCIGKIPQEMQIKDMAIAPGSMTAVFPGDTTANRGDYFKPFPKPEKKKKK